MSRRRSHWKIEGVSLDMAVRPQLGSVVIEEVAGIPMMVVRPHRRRRTYELPLSAAAALMVRTIIQAEVREKRRAKKAARKAKRKTK